MHCGTQVNDLGNDGANAVLEVSAAGGSAYGGNASNQVIWAWVNAPGLDQPVERIAFINGEARNRQVFHADGLGSIAVLTDESGEPVQTYTYAAFGSIRTQTGTDLNRVTYTDRETLGDALGFYYYRYRVYDPNVGRFTSEDPLGFLDGPNMYLYCHNNPVSLVDPLGLIVTWDDIKDDPEKIMMYCTPICGVPEMQNASGLALTGGMVSGNLIMGEWLQAVWNIFQDWLTGKIRQQCEDNP